MPTILAIETSTEVASAALLQGDRRLAYQSTGVQTHSQSILPMVQQLLAEADLTLVQCDAVAFGAGPGSFTGVRTACAIAQGLAFGADLPVVPVVTLQAMAEACREFHGARRVLAALDARMGEVYWGLYEFGDAWQIVREPTLSAAQEVSAIGDPVVCGNALSYLATVLEPDRMNRARPEIMPHAAQVASLAALAFAAGAAIHPRDAQPLYLRNKVALTTNERLARGNT